MAPKKTPPDIRIIELEYGGPLWEQVKNLRLEVFVTEQHVPIELEIDEYDKTAVHLAALEGDQVIGTARLIETGGDLIKIGRVAVAIPARQSGVATALMHRALEYATNHGITEAVLDAQVTVIGFYERLGFVAEGEIFDDAGIDHIRMRRVQKPA